MPYDEDSNCPEFGKVFRNKNITQVCSIVSSITSFSYLLKHHSCEILSSKTTNFNLIPISNNLVLYFEIWLSWDQVLAILSLSVLTVQNTCIFNLLMLTIVNSHFHCISYRICIVQKQVKSKYLNICRIFIHLLFEVVFLYFVEENCSEKLHLLLF